MTPNPDPDPKHIPNLIPNPGPSPNLDPNQAASYGATTIYLATDSSSVLLQAKQLPDLRVISLPGVVRYPYP